MNTNINFAELGIGDFSDLGEIISNPEIFEGGSLSTTPIKIGKTTKYPVSINGRPFPGLLTVSNAKLTRLSLIEQTRADGHTYMIVTGIMKDVNFNLDLVVNGQNINIVDFMFELAKQAAGYKDADRTSFIKTLTEDLKMPLLDDMQIFFQQMGASAAAYEEFILKLNERGLVMADDTKRVNPEQRNRIQRAYVLRDIPVTEFEIGTTDPNQSDMFRSTNGQAEAGFIDLADAIWRNFTRIMKLRKLRSIKLSEIENLSAQNPANLQEMAKQLKTEATHIQKQANSFAGNLGGARLRWTRSESTGEWTVDQKAVYDPTYVPCGKLTVLGTDGEEIKANFWTNRSESSNENKPVFSNLAQSLTDEDFKL
jgi:hypothetical protein